jgi:eukaryotic-like serine/threonine-protein kinase
MHLNVGTHLGRYEILSVVGEGGMGAVYRARDAKLGRDVALKIVHPGSGIAPDLERVRHEAHVLASLTHPHIAAIYELEDAGELAFLVMELVPGETLRERLAQGALPLADALRIGSQIASAIEAAHERGVIHRDLKPANIKITPDGTVKVLDFGLAQVLDVATPEHSLNPTRTSGTAIVGTAAYMSPEQARGRPVDRRTDIWAFGCVMFEMLADRQTFAGETVSDSIAAILGREPDWTALPAATPPPLLRLLTRCLEKDPRRRLRDIGDARLEIEDALSGMSGSATVVAAAAEPRRAHTWRGVMLLAVGCAGGVAITLAVRPQSKAPDAPRAQFVVSMPSNARLASLDYPAVAISPDGSRMAYVASQGGPQQLFVQELESLTATAVPDTFDAVNPFFSADGRSIGFFAGGKLKIASLAGGTPITVCDAPTGFGASWRDDLIVFAGTAAGGLSSVPAGGGAPTRVTTLATDKGEFSHRWPVLLPGGRVVLFTVGTVGSWDDADIVAQSLSTGERRLVVHGATSPQYLSGQLLYIRSGALMAAAFDATRLTVTGTPLKILENVMESADGAAQASVSTTGTMVYVPGAGQLNLRRLLAVDRKGVVTPFAAPAQAYVAPRVSPDGRSIAVTVAGGSDDLWVYDIGRGTLTQLTYQAGVSTSVWTPDSARLTFGSTKAGQANLFWRRMEGGGADERLAPSDRTQLPGSWSADGRTLAFVERDPNTGRDIWILSLDGDRKPRPLLATPFDESAARISPDGNLVAYVSNESGVNEVYVAPIAQPSRPLRASAEPAAEPLWAPRGRELYYRTGNRVMAVSLSEGPAPRVAARQLLFEGRFAKGTLDFANYDAAPNGQFVMVEESDTEALRPEVRVLLHWLK